MFKKKEENKKAIEEVVNENEETSEKVEDTSVEEEEKLASDIDEANLLEEKKPNHENDVDLNVKVEYDNQYLVGIENARTDFFKIFKIENNLKWIMGVFVMAAIFVSFIWLMNISSVIAFVVCGAAIAILIGYYFVIKHINNKKLSKYFEDYYKNLNAYTFIDNPSYSDISGTYENRMDQETFVKCNLYKDVAQVSSRNLITFKYNDIECSIVDCSASIKTVKRLQPVFVGKLLTAPNKYKGEGVTIYLKGNERALPPTNVDELRKVVNTRKMVIYSNASKQPQVINNKLKSILNKIITNNILIDVAISIQEGTTYVALGYDDNLMVLPLQERFNQIPLVQFKKDLEVICELVEHLN